MVTGSSLDLARGLVPAGVWARVMNNTAQIDAAPLAVKANLTTDSSIAPGTFLYANTTVQPSGCFKLNCKTGQYVTVEVGGRWRPEYGLPLLAAVSVFACISRFITLVLHATYVCSLAGT